MSQPLEFNEGEGHLVENEIFQRLIQLINARPPGYRQISFDNSAQIIQAVLGLERIGVALPCRQERGRGAWGLACAGQGGQGGAAAAAGDGGGERKGRVDRRPEYYVD